MVRHVSSVSTVRNNDFALSTGYFLPVNNLASTIASKTKVFPQLTFGFKVRLHDAFIHNSQTNQQYQ